MGHRFNGLSLMPKPQNKNKKISTRLFVFQFSRNGRKVEIEQLTGVRKRDSKSSWMVFVQWQENGSINAGRSVVRVVD